MEFLKYAAIAVLSFGALAVLWFALKSRKPFRRLLLNAFLGFAAFAAVDLTAHFTGVHLPLNEWTASGTAVFGIPAVCGLLLLRMIFGV